MILQHLAITEKDAAAEAGTQEAGLTERQLDIGKRLRSLSLMSKFLKSFIS